VTWLVGSDSVIAVSRVPSQEGDDGFARGRMKLITVKNLNEKLAVKGKKYILTCCVAFPALMTLSPSTSIAFSSVTRSGGESKKSDNEMSNDERHERGLGGVSTALPHMPWARGRKKSLSPRSLQTNHRTHNN
jgi:hypothetical protein